MVLIAAARVRPMFCPSCGSEERQVSQFCRACGTDLALGHNPRKPDALRFGVSARDEIGHDITDSIRDLRRTVISAGSGRRSSSDREFLDPRTRRLRGVREGVVRCDRAGGLRLLLDLGSVGNRCLWVPARRDGFLIGLGSFQCLLFTVPKHTIRPGRSKRRKIWLSRCPSASCL